MLFKNLKHNGRSGFLVTKKEILFIFVIISLIFTGSILATYFGKLTQKISEESCTPLLCNNLNNLSQKCYSTLTSPATVTTPFKVNYRLNENLKPILYDFTIQPYIESMYFDGQIKMLFTCLEPTDEIIFHALDLELDKESFQIDSLDDSKVQVENNYHEDPLTNFITIKMKQNCLKGVNYSLSLNYKGLINTNLYGLYKSSYLDELGRTVNLLTTHFHPTDARRVLPCFDEQAMKAKFKLTIIRHKNFTMSLFNTPLISTTKRDNDWYVDKFETTELMSTYLLAFIISNYKTVQGYTSRGILVEVAAREDAILNGDGDFALEEGLKILDFYEEYFNVSYPLKKCTLAAIPDFNNGAMENWGLIMYRERSLLYDPKKNSLSEKRRVSNIVSHELAHQWFGNLVTPIWWNDIWLNEGFASWVEYLGYNFTHPEWRDVDYFFVQNMKSMILDGLESSHPVSLPVDDPSTVNSLFDAISYEKGASIVRMMNSFLTENTFKKGVTNYLHKYSYSNAEQDNLWEQLTSQAYVDSKLDKSLTIKQIMDTWTLQKGYPLVTITRNYNSNEIKINQKWFLSNPINTIQNTEEYKKHKWYIPVSYTSKDNPKFDFETEPIWLKPNQAETNLQTEIKPESWLIGNLKHSGFYRVNYDMKNWNLLIEQLNKDHLVIDSINRASLIDDAFNLGRAEFLDQTLFMDLIKYLKYENDSLPFETTFPGLDLIEKYLESDFEVYENFKEFCKKLFAKTYERLGWNEQINDANQINLQIRTIKLMCRLGYDECVNKCYELFKNWISNNIEIPLNFKSTLYSTISKFGSVKDWFNLLNRALNSTDNTQKIEIISGLASTSDYNLLKLLINKISDVSIIRIQDKTRLLQTVASNSIGKKLIYDYLEENWKQLFDEYGGLTFTLPNFVDSATEMLNTQYDIDRIKFFVDRNPNLGIASEAFQRAIEKINSNIRWLDKNMLKFKEWLNADSKIKVK